MKWVDKHIEIEKVTRPKKITGTRFAAILGDNRWASPFATWCEITHTYEEPFTDNQYTIAGKTIEPKQAQYIRDNYFTDLASPSEVYGEDYFQTTHGDFFPDKPIFGGMWDYLEVSDGKVTAVYEMKTTKRVEDWEHDIPEYYAKQAALYAYLLNVDQVYMCCSVLEPRDYAHPDEYEPSDKNTFVRGFKVSERYPDMALTVQEAEAWYKKYVRTGISPDYDEKRDAEILKILRKNSLNPDTDMEEVLKEADELIEVIEAAQAAVKEKTERLEIIKGIIKDYCQQNMSPDYNEITLPGHRIVWTYARRKKKEIDKIALKEDGLLDKYTKTTEAFYLTNKKGD